MAVSLRVLLAAVTFVVAAVIATAEKPLERPPVLPDFFEAVFEEWTAPGASPPPYVDGLPTPAAAGSASREMYKSAGFTWYDWTVKHPNGTTQGNMIEARFEYCVNIFPFGNNFTCVFQNVGGATYLISRDWRDPAQRVRPPLPPCCVFGDPWLPPPPDFLRTRVQSEVEATNVPWTGRKPTDNTTWFILRDVPPPAGPFHYAFTESASDPPQLPDTAVFDAFAFPGVKGWVEQNFYHQQTKKPASHVWDLPKQCLPVSGLKNCGFFGVAESLYSPFGHRRRS